jgi:hypothetical protein
MATAAPACALSLPDPIGTLAVGAAGDAVVLALRGGDFTFRDARRVDRIGNQKLEPVAVVRAGRIYKPGHLAGSLRPRTSGPLSLAKRMREHADLFLSACQITLLHRMISPPPADLCYVRRHARLDTARPGRLDDRAGELHRLGRGRCYR